MPDWEQIVAARLTRLRLPPQERAEVIAELASHLEDCHRDLCAAGSPDPVQYTLAQVSDWNALGRRIRKAKEEPMNFRRQVFLPGIAAMMTSALAQMVVFWFGRATWRANAFALPEHQNFFGEHAAVLFTLGWALTFTFGGAVGAALARRAGASASRRMLAAIFPCFYLPAMFGLVWIATIIQGEHLAHPPGLISIVLAWAAVTAACLVGAVPWLFGDSQAEPSHPPRAASA